MKNKLLIFLGLLATFLVSIDVYFNTVTLFSLFLYFLSITIFVILFKNRETTKLIQKGETKGKSNKRGVLILLFLIIVQIALLAYFSNFPFHYHEDEFIEAYTSFSLPAVDKINWFSVFPDKQSWVAQFPILFFIFQKPFFMLFGPSIESIRISTWPYQVLILIYLYLLSKEYFSSRLSSASSILIFIFLAPNLYISSIGIHVISSTLFLLAGFYYLTLMMKKHNSNHAILCGIFTALSYLTYPGSYIALPIFLIFLTVESVKQWSLKPAKFFIITLVFWFLIMLPFLVYALTKDNFFTQRLGQVNFPWGTWGQTQQQLQAGSNLINLVKAQALINVKSLYDNGFGGIGEYYFGRQALFNPVTFAFLLAGFCISIYKGIFKNRSYLYPISIIIIVFLTGMILTIPPGAIHRLSVVFPFIALVMAMVVDLISKRVKLGNKNISLLYLVIALLLIFCLTNFKSAITMIKEDKKISILTDSVYISSYIEENVPKGSMILISAFPSYHLQRELIFRTRNSYKFTTNYFPEILPFTDKNNILILHYPDSSQIQQLYSNFPNGKIINTINGSNLKIHAIFIPN